ncbi:MAG: ABC transporter ATP-binding protein [Sciscionella sp.]
MNSSLSLKALSGGYGRVRVVRDVTLSVAGGMIVSLIGANGAGKSTLLCTLAGTLKPMGGSVQLDSLDLTGRSPEQVVRAGMALIAEGRQLFGELTVRQNLLLGTHALKCTRRQRAEALKYVADIFPVLGERAHHRCDRLSGGQQQMVAIGRGLMSKPRVLLLDEPSLGLAPIVVREMLAALSRLRDDGTAILLVEQHAALALQHSDYAYLIERGQIILEGPASAVAEDSRVSTSYLGRATADPLDPLPPAKAEGV